MKGRPDFSALPPESQIFMLQWNPGHVVPYSSSPDNKSRCAKFLPSADRSQGLEKPASFLIVKKTTTTKHASECFLYFHRPLLVGYIVKSTSHQNSLWPIPDKIFQAALESFLSDMPAIISLKGSFSFHSLSSSQKAAQPTYFSKKKKLSRAFSGMALLYKGHPIHSCCLDRLAQSLSCCQSLHWHCQSRSMRYEYYTTLRNFQCHQTVKPRPQNFLENQPT